MKFIPRYLIVYDAPNYPGLNSNISMTYTNWAAICLKLGMLPYVTERLYARQNLSNYVTEHRTLSQSIPSFPLNFPQNIDYWSMSPTFSPSNLGTFCMTSSSRNCHTILCKIFIFIIIIYHTYTHTLDRVIKR